MAFAMGYLPNRLKNIPNLLGNNYLVAEYIDPTFGGLNDRWSKQLRGVRWQDVIDDSRFNLDLGKKWFLKVDRHVRD